MPQNYDPIRGDALPVLPFFLYQGEAGTDPQAINAEKTFQAMYAVWSGLRGVRGCTAVDFKKFISATPVDVSPVPPEWAWPVLQEEGAAEVADAGECNYECMDQT